MKVRVRCPVPFESLVARWCWSVVVALTHLLWWMTSSRRARHCWLCRTAANPDQYCPQTQSLLAQEWDWCFEQTASGPRLVIAFKDVEKALRA